MTKGQKIRLSNGRRLIDEVIRAGGKMQMATYARDFDVSDLARLRKKIRPRISWNVMYLKAYAIIADRIPELRQCYVGFPWPYAYQHEHNIGLVTVAREYKGEERLLFAKFNQPEIESLVDLQELYDVFRKSPVDEVPQFKKQMRFAQMPFLFRRLAFWMLFNMFPRKRMSNFGTFGMTISRYRDADLETNVLGPNSTLLGIDVLPKKGIARFSLTFDHQIIDGVPVINVIDEVYKTLNGPIKEELEALVAEQNACANETAVESHGNEKSAA